MKSDQDSKSMKAVVTGGSGALGRVVVAELEANGFDVLSLDRKPHPDGHKRAWIIDLRNAGALYEACKDVDAVVHLASHLAPDLTSACDTFNDNVQMSYNVLKAATDCGVRKIVAASSTTIYGFVYERKGGTPQYLPADENLPALATDPYSLSKIVGERIAAAFADSTGASITSLRFPTVNFDPNFSRMRELLVDPSFRAPGFWSYLDVRDAATAVRLALGRESGGHQTYNIACSRSNMAEDTSDLIKRFYPDLRDVRKKTSDNWSGIDSTAAARDLGFSPRFHWGDAA